MANGGPRDGAGEVSGAPWHERSLQLDGSGNRNQDRSIQPSAIVGELPPRALAPPTPAPRRPTTRAVVTPPPAGGGGGGGGIGAPVDPPVPTAPATSIGLVPDAPAPGTSWGVVALLSLVALGGYVAAIARSRGRGRRDRRRS
jgi:hypothetical protein